MLGGFVAEKVGRKRGLLLSQLMGTIGGVIMAVSQPTMAWEVLLVGRLVVGLAAGLNTVLVPIYISEIAPVHLRGALGVFNQLGNIPLTLLFIFINLNYSCDIWNIPGSGARSE